MHNSWGGEGSLSEGVMFTDGGVVGVTLGAGGSCWTIWVGPMDTAHFFCPRKLPFDEAQLCSHEQKMPGWHLSSLP